MDDSVPGSALPSPPDASVEVIPDPALDQVSRIGRALPPDAPPAPVAAPQPPPAPGQLTNGWRMTLATTWTLVLLSWAAVWKSSWTLGLSTWWLGPQVSPRFFGILLLPFVLPIITVAATVRRVGYVPFIGIVAAVAGAGIGAGDIDRQNAFAVVEIAVSAGALLVSLAAFAGMYRVDRSAAAGERTCDAFGAASSP